MKKFTLLMFLTLLWPGSTFALSPIEMKSNAPNNFLLGSIMAPCEAGDVPFYDGFESGYNEGDALGGCWTQASVEGALQWIVNSVDESYNRAPRTGDFNITLRWGNETWMFYPLNLTGGTEYELQFYARQDAEIGASILASFGDEDTDAAMTNAIIAESEVVNGDYQAFSGRFTPADSGVYYIGIKATLDSANPFYVSLDDISVEAIASACNIPTDLIVSSVGETSADLSWNAGGSETEWEVLYGENGFDPATEGTSTTVNDDPETTLTGLNLGTEYEFYVIAICGMDESDMAGPVSFTTETSCGAASVPYTMDFDSAIVPDLPECTSRENLGDGNQWKTQVYSDHGMSGNVLSHGYHNVHDANAWFYTQGIALQENVNYLISYKYFGSATWPEKMKVAYGTSANSTDMTVELADHSSIGAAGDEQYVFTVPADGVYYFGFNVYSDANQNYLYLDDIKIQEEPTCMPVTDLTAEATTTDSANLSWTAGDAEIEWEVLYGEAGFDPTSDGATVTVNDNPETIINDLDAGTIYDFYVRAICGVGDESEWAGPATSATACEPGQIPFAEGFESGYSNGDALGVCWSQTSVSGSQSWIVNNTETDYNRAPRTGDWNIYLRYGNEDWIYYALELTADTQYELEFYARQNVTNGASIEAAFGTENEPSAMTETIIAASDVVNGDYQKFNGYFTPTTSGVYYIGIKGTLTGAPWYLSIDDIRVDLAPSCLAPTELMVANVSDSTADLSWTAGQDETEWKVIYGVVGFDPSTEGTTVEVNEDAETTITDLDSNTAYEFYVKAMCDGTDESELAGPKEFTTACVAGETPFVEGFESHAAGALSGCWTQTTIEGTEVWFVNETETTYNRTPRTGDKNVTLRWGNDAWMFYPLELTADATYELEFYARQDATTGASVEAAYGSTNDPAAMTNSIIEQSIVVDGDYQKFSATFSPTTSGVHYVGIKGMVTMTPWHLSIDDIAVNEIITCIPVADITVTDISENSATVSWTESTTATDGYEVEVYLDGEDPTTATPQVSETVAAGVTTATITGLHADTAYDVYVIADCGDDTAISDVVKFTTTDLGVNSNNLTKISYFPNPVKDELTITAAGKLDMVIVTNLLGQTVMQVEPKSTNVVLDMSALPVGTYILKANLESATSTFKVIKE